MFDGQLSEHTVEVPTTVADVLAELSDGRGSLVVLEITAELVITVPFGALEFTLKASVKTATWLTARVAIVQVIVPALLPTTGVTHVNAGPEFCTSDTKVVFPGIASVSVTTCASSGPWLITSTV